MGEGPALLLVHGTGASTHSWRDVMPILARHYSVIAADLPGHGLTAAVSGARSSIGGMGDALAALLRTLELNPRFCVGHSAGAVVLSRMSLDRHIAPQVIVSINGAFLPLQGAAGWVFSPVARLLANTAFVPRLISRHTGTAGVSRLIAGTGSSLDAAGIEFYTRLARDPKHLAGALNMMSHWKLHEFERELPRLRVPLVLIAADNDLTVPPHQALVVQQRVAHAVVRRLAGLGHLAHEERPAQMAQILLETFAAHGGVAAAAPSPAARVR
jgi:magnesium chelatase accessory protein